MLAGRVLPPIHPRPSSPPLATFYNIPRRYARSNMQAVENASPHLLLDDLKPSRPVRKTNRSYELRSSPTSNPVRKVESELPSPVSSIASTKHTKKRSQDDFNGAVPGDLSDPEHSRASASASSSPGEHVCLCQPEPKIPRPRNGKPVFLYRRLRLWRFASIARSDVTMIRTKKDALCLRTCTGRTG